MSYSQPLILLAILVSSLIKIYHLHNISHISRSKLSNQYSTPPIIQPSKSLMAIYSPVVCVLEEKIKRRRPSSSQPSVFKYIYGSRCPTITRYIWSHSKSRCVQIQQSIRHYIRVLYDPRTNGYRHSYVMMECIAAYDWTRVPLGMKSSVFTFVWAVKEIIGSVEQFTEVTWLWF